MARKGGARRGRRVVLDAYLSFIIFGAVGIATWRLEQLLRLTLMWLALLGLTVIYGSGRRIQLTYGFSELGRGALAGLVISVPIMLATRDFLVVTSQRLFSDAGTLTLFWILVLIMAPMEALYFRGFVQGEKGLWAAVLLYAVATGIYFMPATLGGYLPVLAALVGSMALLGFVYSYIRVAYGFGATLTCQVTVHFVLFVLPFLSREFAGLLA